MSHSGLSKGALAVEVFSASDIWALTDGDGLSELAADLIISRGKNFDDQI
jgi:hypothetical protein